MVGTAPELRPRQRGTRNLVRFSLVCLGLLALSGIPAAFFLEDSGPELRRHRVRQTFGASEVERPPMPALPVAHRLRDHVAPKDAPRFGGEFTDNPVGFSLRVLDADRVPLPQAVPFVVFRETPDRELLVKGRTDSRGWARVENLPQGSLIVESLREPPFAASAVAVSGVIDESSLVELVVTPGTVLEGLVTDDQGRALVGVVAEALLPWPHGSDESQLTTITNSRGEFLFEAMSSPPRQVVWNQGVSQVGQRAKTLLRVEHEGETTTLEAEFDPTTQSSRVEVVLPRPIQLRGRVLTEKGDPVAGAILRTSAEPPATDSPPADAPEPVVTSDGAGNFELRLGVSAEEIWVHGTDRPPQRFTLPSWAPGTTKERDFVLSDSTEFFLAITVRDEPNWKELASSARVLARTDQRWVEATLEATEDAPLLRVRVALPATEIRALSFEAPGYQTTEWETRGGITPGATETIRPPQVRVHQLKLRVIPPKTSAASSIGIIRACLLEPGLPRAAGECCGLGSAKTLGVLSEPTLVSLDVRAPGDYWVLVQRGVDVTRHGPYAAHGRPHRLELPAAPLDSLAHEVPAPEPAEALDRSRLCASKVQLVSAATGTKIAWTPVRIAARSIEEDQAPFRLASSRTGPEGTVDVELAEGSWFLAVAAEGHAAAEQGPFYFHQSSAYAGEIYLQTEQQRATTLQITQQDGTPIPSGTEVRWESSIHPIPVPGTIGNEPGLVSFPLPPDEQTGTLHIAQRAPTDWSSKAVGHQRVAVDLSSNTSDIVMSPWTLVEIRVHGIPRVHYAASLAMHWSVTGPASPTLERKPDLPGGTRVYRTMVVAGDYELQSVGGLYAFPKTPVDATRGGELIIDVTASRR